MPTSNLGRTIDTYTPGLPGRQTVTCALVVGHAAIWSTPAGYSIGAWDAYRAAYRVIADGMGYEDALGIAHAQNAPPPAVVELEESVKRDTQYRLTETVEAVGDAIEAFIGQPAPPDYSPWWVTPNQWRYEGGCITAIYTPDGGWDYQRNPRR